MRGGLIVAAIFFLTAMALSGVLPLWLDEVMQLIETRDKPLPEMIATVSSANAGAVPLGYLVQQASLRITGYSIRRARLPAVLFGSAAVLLAALLGAELGLRQAWLGAAIFGAFPLTLRYATESRVYSQALFFSVAASLIYLRLARRPGWRTGLIYWLTLVLAVYTQPFAAFAGLAHILWSAINRDRRAALFGVGALSMAILTFLPWYLWSKGQWQQGIALAGLHFTVSAKTPLMLFRELTGAGYWGSGLLLILCILGAAALRSSPLIARFLILCIVVPAVCGLCADAVQFIFLLPILAILATAGIERKSPLSLVLLISLGAVCVVQSVRYFTAPHEDWQMAADTLAIEVKRGGCLIVVPPDQARYYEFFQPQLREARCQAPRMVISATPYSTSKDRQAAIADLTTRGYKQESDRLVGKSNITTFYR
jgi:4-amino-4-deoxy-L-arabinose transferase-like glycosyltransferase